MQSKVMTVNKHVVSWTEVINTITSTTTICSEQALRWLIIDEQDLAQWDLFSSSGEAEATGQTELRETSGPRGVQRSLHLSKTFLMAGEGPIKYSLKTFSTISHKLIFWDYHKSCMCCFESFLEVHRFPLFAYLRIVDMGIVWMRALTMMAVILEIRKVSHKL